MPAAALPLSWELKKPIPPISDPEMMFPDPTEAEVDCPESEVKVRDMYSSPETLSLKFSLPERKAPPGWEGSRVSASRERPVMLGARVSGPVPGAGLLP